MRVLDSTHAHILLRQRPEFRAWLSTQFPGGWSDIAEIAFLGDALAVTRIDKADPLHRTETRVLLEIVVPAWIDKFCVDR